MKYLLFVLLVSVRLCVHAQNPSDLIQSGNTLYESGAFEDALKSYEAAMVDAHGVNLYFNAGNAAFKTGALGKAILYYERAKKIDPTAEDVNNNLQIANAKVVDRIESLPSLGVENLWGVLTSQSKLNTWAWLAIVFNFIGFAVLAVRLFTVKLVLKRTLLIAGLVVFFCGLGFYGLSRAANSRLNRSTEAIVLAPSIIVRNAPSDSSQEAFVLHEGTKIKIISTQENWNEIKIANGSVGWMPSDASEPI